MKLKSFKPFKLEEIERFEPDPEEKFFRFAARETTLARDEIWMSWLVTHGTKSFIDVPNRNIYDYYLHEETALATLKKLGQFIESDFEAHIARYNVKKEKAIQNAGVLARLVNGKKDAETLIKVHEALIHSQWDLAEWIWGAWSVIHFYEPEVMEKLGTHEGIESVGALEEPIEFLKMKRDLFYLPPTKWVAAYGWLNMYSPPDASYNEQDFEKIKAETIKEEIEQEFENFEKVHETFERFVSKIADEHLKLIARMVHAYAFIKTDRVDVWRQIMYHTVPFYIYLAELLGKDFSINEASSLSIQETHMIIRGERPETATLEKLQLRAQNKALYVLSSDSITCTYDEQSRIQTLKTLEGEIKNVTEFKGVVTCKGKARGKAKIITHSEHLVKIEEGDIFVAKYTFPTFTPYMIKSAAIITDEGGLTSHAAIISREYNKPCIVGTKIATQVLKDGDEIEVDAEKGIVRIL